MIATSLTIMAAQVFRDTCDAAEDSNVWNAFDKCEELLALINDFRDEVIKYQNFCEKCCDSIEPNCYM